MLIVAIPKSASSSLIDTLCNVHQLRDVSNESRSYMRTELPPACHYEALARLHPDEIRDLTDGILTFISGADILVKHHFPPTENNRRLLRSSRKVILLRDPDGVLGAYWRAAIAGGSRILQDDTYGLCLTERCFRKKAEQNRLLDDLARFYRRWENHEGDKLVVKYEDLMSDPGRTIGLIEEYLRLPVTGSKTLSRMKYTRNRMDCKHRLLFLMKRIRAVVKMQ